MDPDGSRGGLHLDQYYIQLTQQVDLQSSGTSFALVLLQLAA